MSAHVRPGGERVVCVRIAGHPGRHTALAQHPPLFTWNREEAPTALRAAIATPEHACLGCDQPNCTH